MKASAPNASLHQGRDRRGLNVRRWLLGALLALNVAAPMESACADDFVAIVNADNDVTELSLLDLRRIYRGERKHWKSGDPIRVLLPHRGSPAMQFVVAKVFEMKSVVEVAQYYLEAIYQEKIATPPPTMTLDASLSAVANSKYAIAVVPRNSAVGWAGLKILDLPSD